MFDGPMDVLVQQKAALDAEFLQLLTAQAKEAGTEIPPDAAADLPSPYRGHSDFISPENEIAAWQLIARAAGKRLTEYVSTGGSSSAEDLACLKLITESQEKDGAIVDHGVFNCIWLGIEDKTLLEFLKETANRVETVLGLA